MTDPTRLNEYNLSEEPAIDLQLQAEAERLRKVKRGLMQMISSSQV